MSHYFFISIVVLLLVLSIVCQIMIGVLYQNMILETDNMTATDNKLLKQCKMRFANCYKMNSGVSNIPVFVDKFINRIRIGRISLVTIQHLSGQLVLLSVFVSGLGIYNGITRGERILSLFPFYIISLLGLYLYFGVSSFVDLSEKKRLLKTNLIDYMENHMVNRLKMLPESEQRLEEAEAAYRSQERFSEKSNQHNRVQTKAEKKCHKSTISKENEAELERLLGEFLY